MIDYAKRKTIKTIAAASAGLAATVATSAGASALLATTGTTHDCALPGLANIEVTTRISATKNDLEVVLKNTADSAVTITHMTPTVTNVPRGQFNFSALLKDGPLHLAAGESTVVPLQQHTASVMTTQKACGLSLTDSLKRTMSIVADGNSFASVSIVDNIAIA